MLPGVLPPTIRQLFTIRSDYDAGAGIAAGHYLLRGSVILRMPPVPTVSIIVPNYNYARFLDRRLGSIEAQTFRDFELILLDDASSDDSAAILQAFAARHGARLVRNQHNSGNPFVQWNRGVALARGEFVWIAEADDDADPRFLETLVAVLRRDPHCGVVQCASIRIDATGRRGDTVAVTLHDVDRNRWRQDFRNSGADECARYLVRECTIPNASAVLFRRSLFEAVGGADETLRLAGDWKLWAAILCRSDFAFVATPLNFFRTHAATVRSRTGVWERILEGLQVMRFIVAHQDIPADSLADLHGRLMVLFLHGALSAWPTATQRTAIRDGLPGVRFRLSRGTWRALLRQAVDALRRRLQGAPDG